ncbi:MAG: chorismate synthase [Christensenellales bacterium]|jgi:chorismate synthase|nr:chorismate synthase [Clostridiales bacterium]
MSSIWGRNIQLSIFGEAHGEYVGGTLHNFPAGVEINLDRINLGLKLRQGSITFAPVKRVDDRPIIISGVTRGITNGSPITVLFANPNYQPIDNKKEPPKPSHADYVAMQRFNNAADMGGGGHLSGRLTLPIVFFGMMCADFLAYKGIEVVSHIKSIGKVKDESFGVQIDPILVERLNSSSFPTISQEARKLMTSLISSIYALDDSIGGSIETAIVGLDAGYGSPIFDNLESNLASFFFAIPAVKAFEIGHGVDFGYSRGSEVTDSFVIDEEGKVTTNNNFNGGMNGGISNGMPIVIKTTLKPIPSIHQLQNTLDFETNKVIDLELHREHVASLVPRSNIIMTSAAAITFFDAYLGCHGYKNTILTKEEIEAYKYKEKQKLENQ